MIPVISDYLAQVWAIERGRFDHNLQQLRAWRPTAEQMAALVRHVETRRARAGSVYGGDDAHPSCRVEEVDGVAILDVCGVLMKSVPPCYELFGGAACCTDDVRTALAEAERNPRARVVALVIDSPGGTVDGLAELAHDVHRVRATKPVHAIVRDCACSAAYWLAAQCETVSANETALLGSIGVYLAVEDTSEAYQREGVTVHVISSGGVKGAGLDGTKILPEHLASWQSRIDDLVAVFVREVAEGRGMAARDVRALATGETWLGAKARALGLIDFVEDSADALSRILGGTT